MAAKWQEWMPWHIDHFRGSPAVQAMHPVARIAYLYILGAMWQTDDCTIASDPLTLADLSGVGDDLWAQYSPRVLRCFRESSPGRLTNDVLLEHWTRAYAVYQKRISSAERTNATRSPHGHRDDKPTVADHLPAVSERSPHGDWHTVTGTYTETKEQTPPTRATREEPPQPQSPPSTKESSGYPEGMPVLAMVTELFARTALTQPFGVRQLAGEAIEAIARAENETLHGAAGVLECRIRQAQCRGSTVNRFWFEDGGWTASKQAGEESHAHAAGERDRRSPAATRVANMRSAIRQAAIEQGFGGACDADGPDSG